MSTTTFTHWHVTTTTTEHGLHLDNHGQVATFTEHVAQAAALTACAQLRATREGAVAGRATTVSAIININHRGTPWQVVAGQPLANVPENS